MANCLFGYPNYSDVSVLYTPTFSVAIGGSWSSTLPLTNLQDRRLSLVARSSSASPADTRFSCTLGALRSVGLVAIPKHTVSAAGSIRARGFFGQPGLSFFSPDFSTGWSLVATPTRVAAAVTGTDGVSLDLIGDDNAGALEGYTKVCAFAGDAVKACCLKVRQNTSTSSAFRLRDTTAGANRLLGVLTWSGGLPVVTMTTGTYVGYRVIGGSFRLSFISASVTTANTNQWEVYPATTSALATANTGTLYCGDLEIYNTDTDRLAADSGYVSAAPAGLTAEDTVGLNVPFVYIPTEGVFANDATDNIGEYLFEINDPTNTAGYVDLARLVIAGTFQPEVNMDYGAAFGLETDTVRNRTDGGSAQYHVKPNRRMVNASLSLLTEDEALSQFFAMQQHLGISGQLFFAWDPADATYAWRRSFLATFRELNPLENAMLARHRAPFALVEEI
ncbi:MAG TPA: hypothetical protein VK681_38965 [Reyranella sp.]|nr:hypothetical protein [Reyranella sp.]